MFKRKDTPNLLFRLQDVCFWLRKKPGGTPLSPLLSRAWRCDARPEGWGRVPAAAQTRGRPGRRGGAGGAGACQGRGGVASGDVSRLPLPPEMAVGQKSVPQWNQGLKPADPWFNFDPYPNWFSHD